MASIPSGWHTTFGRFSRHTRNTSQPSTKGSSVAVRIRLSDGSSFVVESTYDELNKTVNSAIEAGLPFIQVRNGDGKMRSINPRQIAYLEETDEESLTPEEEQILDAVQDRREVQQQ